jgi:hypothetical protein
MKRKVKILKAKGGADAATESFGKSVGFSGSSRPDPHGGFDLSGGKGPTFNNAPATTGGSKNKTTTQVNTNTNNKNTNAGQKTTFMPITLQVAKALVIDPLTKHSRTQKVKGESFFGKPKDLPASKDYYRAYGEPIDVMSKKGTDFMKDAGLIKPIKTVKPPEDRGENRQQLCPDGTYPPCKTPVTQIKTPVTKPNTFLSGFQAYDDGGEVVISSNVDKSLL